MPSGGETRVDGAELRHVLGHFATGVTVVTARCDGEPVGMVANSFTSVSLQPPLVLFCAGVESETWPRIRAAAEFCVNVLGHHQRELAVSFARKGTDRYEGVELVDHGEGPPRLAGAIAHIDCRIWAEYAGGDHTVVVGEVLELAVADADAAALEEPLIFYRGGFTTARETPE
jgi:3-hydroxy-9,10-secoandrosta-1,3,5(10)-triene-9,17-dione monooxygenase reductase component